MNKVKLKQGFKKWYIYYILFIPCIVLAFLFHYLPMAGIVVAFKDFWPKYGMFFSPWAEPFYGHFQELFQDIYFWRVMKNTLIISGLRILVCFPAPIFLSLIFNELKLGAFKRVSQTIMYIPHFLSWVVLAGMLKRMLLSDGLINSILGLVGIGPVAFLTESGPFLATVILSDVWKNMGFGMIVYLAAMAGINSSLYEAAELDGASRLQKIRFITLPGIAVAVSVQLILLLSNVLNGGFDQIYNLYSTPVYDVADIIDTYVFRIGLTEGKVEFGTALGFFKSVIALTLVLTTNYVTKKVGGTGVW